LLILELDISCSLFLIIVVSGFIYILSINANLKNDNKILKFKIYKINQKINEAKENITNSEDELNNLEETNKEKIKEFEIWKNLKEKINQSL